MANAIAEDTKINCQKEAENIARELSKKRGNLSPAQLIGTANPTEKEGDAIVVYIGAHAGYNYFKFKFRNDCKTYQVIDSEYFK